MADDPNIPGDESSSIDVPFAHVSDAAPIIDRPHSRRFDEMARALLAVGDDAVVNLLREVRTEHLDARLEQYASLPKSNGGLERPFSLIYQRAAMNAAKLIKRLAIASTPLCDGRGDSPIEMAFHAALVVEASCGDFKFEVVSTKRCERFDWDRGDELTMAIEPQITLFGTRVDFVVSIKNGDGPEYLIVECDGHDFHERTPTQASRDRARDVRFQLAGIPIFRFTGTQITRDPIGCAEQVIAWAAQRYTGGA